MRGWVMRWIRRGMWLAIGAVIAITVVRAIESWHADPLAPWHSVALDEPSAAAIDRLDWAGYLAAEARIFAQMQREVTDRLPPELRFPGNRYFAGSPNHPGGFARDWNRSYVLEPEGPPRGAVVLLHGLTDAPYSLRHIAERYRALGFIAIGPRLPGHGALPSGLTTATWEDWAAATRLAMREARARAPTGTPLHVVGYSTGGALALHHAMQALEDSALPRPDRLVLLSPMIAVSGFARFAGIAGLPALLPAFASAAWLGILPEFNPFKFNSFPVNAARQSFQLTQVIQGQLQRRTEGLPPILAFQSVTDFTVSARAVVDTLFARLPANGSELVLFDRNHATPLGLLLATSADDVALNRLPPAPRPWALTLVTNGGTNAPGVVARHTPAGATGATDTPLGLDYPPDVHSLSHVALPFPASDPVYGGAAALPPEFGVALGRIAARGETGVLVMSLDALLRMSWNPFFEPMLARIEAQAGPGAR